MSGKKIIRRHVAGVRRRGGKSEVLPIPVREPGRRVDLRSNLVDSSLVVTVLEWKPIVSADEVIRKTATFCICTPVCG